MGKSLSGWRFPKVFWFANSVELFERAAYYGTFIALSVYLTDVAGFGDVWAGWIGAGFAALIYLLPFFTGAVADRMGFRKALLLAFACLSAGYGALGLLSQKAPVLAALTCIAIGGAFVKPIITGTVSKCSAEDTRARAFSLFYMVVNIGSFTGKTIAKPVRVAMGVDAVPLYSAGAALIALVIVALFYRPAEETSGQPRSASESLQGMWAALCNVRFLALILITAGFWAIQGQLYASMPKYVLRMVGQGASPEWYANVNPFVVVICVVPITYLVRRLRAETSIGVAMGMIPFSALAMALSPRLSSGITLFGAPLHPITIVMVAGIALQGLAECFLSPRYLEYASRQAPKGQEGLYMGYAHLNTFFAWFFGFVASGYLLEAFCPDPKKLSAADQALRMASLEGLGPMPAAYAHAHYIWFAFAGVGAAAFAAMVLFSLLTHGEKR